jgi:hypothetical protein
MVLLLYSHISGAGVTTENMLKVIRNIIFPGLVILLSCDEQPLIVRCKDCTETEPVIAFLEAKIDFPFSGGHTSMLYFCNLFVLGKLMDYSILENKYRTCFI